MLSKKSGRPVANQFIITGESRNGLVELYFQSYQTIIAKKEYKNLPNVGLRCIIKLDQNSWNYSRTTSRCCSQFLGETTAETKKKIKSGEYILTNLN